MIDVLHKKDGKYIQLDSTCEGVILEATSHVTIIEDEPETYHIASVYGKRDRSVHDRDV